MYNGWQNICHTWQTSINAANESIKTFLNTGFGLNRCEAGAICKKKANKYVTLLIIGVA